MTALLNALRRIETQRPARSSAPAAPVQESPAAPEVSAPVVSPQSIAEPATIRMPRREKRPVAPIGEAPLNSRATVAADVEAAAVALVHRFRAPALVALVTCGDAEADAEIVAAIATAIEDQGFAVELVDEVEIDGVSTPAELRTSRGYRLLHTTTAAAMEQTRLLGRADGVVLLVELHRTPIQEAEAAVGMLRREAVAVSGILVID
jgi:hypothetical protein